MYWIAIGYLCLQEGLQFGQEWGSGSLSSQAPVSAAVMLSSFLKSIKHRDGGQAAGACWGNGRHLIAPSARPCQWGPEMNCSPAPLPATPEGVTRPGWPVARLAPARADFFAQEQHALPPEAGGSARNSRMKGGCLSHPALRISAAHVSCPPSEEAPLLPLPAPELCWITSST